jgi:uncharacterized membrane protein
MRKFLVAILILSIVGIGLSFWAFDLHYSYHPEAVCNINDYFSCETVNKSYYSEIFGIPVALIGLLGYAALLLVAAVGLVWQEKIRIAVWTLVFMSSAAVLFSLYLTFVEFFILRAVCIICIGSQLVIIAVLVLSLLSRKRLSIDSGEKIS